METDMGRPARFIPENKDGVLVEVTGRVIGARALLVPSPDPRRFNEIVVGVIGRALEVSPLELCSAAWTANHHHLLVVVHDQQQLSRFMHHLAGNISKEIGGRLRGWRGAFWERRYDGIVVSGEPEAQWRRLKYHLSHGVKEGLVESPLRWPGVHAAKSLVYGEPMEGYWFNRSAEWSARNRGLDVGRYDFATRYRVSFSPLPAFRELTPEQYQNKVAELIREGCYPPALAFTGLAPPRRPPSPPTRQIEILDSGQVERGEIPVVELAVADRATRPAACARGQPP